MGQDLSMVVNNAGQIAMNAFFKLPPNKIYNEHLLNLNAITLLTKAAKIEFQKQAKENPRRRFAMIQLSSCGSDILMPSAAHYQGTKRYDEVFSKCLAF